jgi:streptogramin lyase
MALFRSALALGAGVALVGASHGSGAPTLRAPQTATAGMPVAVVVTGAPASKRVDVVATRGALRLLVPAVGSSANRRAILRFPVAGRWRLIARGAGKAVASRWTSVVEPTVRHPYAVVVDPRGRVFVTDGAARRIVLINPVTTRRSVHAVGFDEPTGLAATRDALYVADFHAGLVRRVDAGRRVTALAQLPEVTAVAAAPSGTVYAVTMSGTLARISPTGAIARIRIPGGLDRPHGVVLDRDGRLLVAEDSRRVRRIDPATGRVELVVDGVDTNKIAVGPDGTLFLAGASPTGGSLRRLEPGGRPTILLDDLKVSDVGVLPDGDLVATAVEPGAVYRVDAHSGARKRLAG